jgi:hypothetical protein
MTEDSYDDEPMIASCIHNYAGDLHEPLYGFVYSPEYEFDLTLGANYTVFAMGFFGATLYVLVRDDGGTPDWMPVNVFSMEKSPVPEGWVFVLVDPVRAVGGSAISGWSAIWGYPELVSDVEFITRLNDREPHSLEVFAKIFDRFNHL